MSNETAEPTRAEWTEFSNDVQRDINETLDAFQLEIEATNSLLAELNKSDAEKATAKAIEATQYLNEKWSYLGDVFMVTGKWHMPIGFTTSTKGFELSHEKQEAFKVVHSAGFAAMEFGEGDLKETRIGLSFLVGQQDIDTPVFRANVQLLAFAEPHEVSVQFVRPASPDVVSSSLEEVIRTISTSEALLQMYLNHAGTSFFQQSAKRQSAFLQELIEAIHSVLPAPESGDMLKLINGVTSSVYFKSPTDNEINFCVAESPDQKYQITGDVLGVTLLDILENGYNKAYRSPDEMLASYTGLCLIVRPRTLNFNAEKMGTSDLLVPLQSLESHSMKLV